MSEKAKNTIEMEDIVASLHAVNGMLSILWEAVDGNDAVSDSVYGIRELVSATTDKLEELTERS